MACICTSIHLSIYLSIDLSWRANRFHYVCINIKIYLLWGIIPIWSLHFMQMLKFPKFYRRNWELKSGRFCPDFSIFLVSFDLLSPPKKTLRAQRLKKNQDPEIFKRDWTFQARRPPDPYFYGEFWRSGLKFSSEIENFKRDWKFQSRLIFSIFLVNLFLTNLVRISGSSSLFLATAVLSAHFARKC